MADIIRPTSPQEEYPPRPRGDDGELLPKDEPVPFVRVPSPVAPAGPGGRGVGPGAGKPGEPGDHAPVGADRGGSADRGGGADDTAGTSSPITGTLSRPFSTLLIANRGEIARRINATAHAMGLRTVAVYAEPDRRSPHVAEADVAVALHGSTAEQSYLDIAKIIAAAKATGAEAVHPGYGFLSENALFAQACADAGLVLVGPTARNIASMGDKVEAKRVAFAAGVPTLPSAAFDGDSPEEWRRSAESVGFPLLVKAAAGGGGRGMRVVRTVDELAEAVVSARREAAASFGDGTVFAERYLDHARHIEIQVFADTLGNAVHLHERECSVQRRHQKIIEEAPSTAVDADLRRRMGDASVALVRAIGYVGAGTIEYLLADSGEFAFLEMNTRLQVEHPVTEAITGVDLVRWQLDVAMGRPLPLTQADVELYGHAVEVRLYAEDAAKGFLPTYGVLDRYRHAPARPGLRFDDGVVSGSEVSTFFDPLLAKVIAHAPTRSEVINVLARALADCEIHGVVTNRDYLVAVLRDPDFGAGRTSTAFVGEHGALLTQEMPAETRRRHIAAAAIVGAHQRRTCDRLWSFAPSGWRNVLSGPQSISYLCAAITHKVGYTIAPDGGFSVDVDGVAVSGRVLTSDEVSPQEAVVVLETGDGMSHRCRVRVRGERTWVNSVDGQTDLLELERFPVPADVATAGGPTAPVPGRVVAVHVSVGDRVEANQVLVVIEAMKMEHRIEASDAGVVVEVLVAVGDQVDAHQLLVELGPISPS